MNSIFTYQKTIRPELNERQHEVYNVLKKLNGATMHQIRDYIRTYRDVELHQISGRFGEMEKKGWIKGEKGPNNRTIWKPL